MSKSNKTTLILHITSSPKKNWECFKEVLMEAEHICPDCYSSSVYHYFERLVIYDKDSKIVGFKDWGDFVIPFR